MNVEAVLGLWQDRPSSEALTTAAHADQIGFRRLWIGEMATYDAFALATRIATATPRIEPVVGPLAVNIRSPVAIAMGVASVHDLTGRTTHVALGTSSPTVVERWHGRSRKGSTEALATTATSVRILLAGRRDPATGFRLRTPPVPAEITIAGFGPRAVVHAAAHTGRLLLNMVTPEAVATFRAKLDAIDGARTHLSAWLIGAVDPTPEDIAQIRSAVVGYLGAPGYGEMFSAAGFAEVVRLARSGAHPREVLEAIPDGFERSVGLVGAKSEISQILERYREAGLDTACVVPVTGSGDAGRRVLETVFELSAANEAD
ncbi:MAG: LLM class F420-dependent oxidoreductase [Acidimicrobiia bacterium]